MQDTNRMADQANKMAQQAQERFPPHYGAMTLVYVNDAKDHAAVLSLFEEVIAAGYLWVSRMHVPRHC